MGKKRNVVLYLDSELVRKSRELGFNLSKTFENHLKTLISHFQSVNITEMGENRIVVGSPGRFELPSAGPEPAICTLAVVTSIFDKPLCR